MRDRSKQINPTLAAQDAAFARQAMRLASLPDYFRCPSLPPTSLPLDNVHE
jgi:hypothetical protein